MARVAGSVARGPVAEPASRPMPISCIGLSGQMHGAVLLDAGGAVAAAVDHLVRSAHRSRVPLARRHGRPRSAAPADVESRAHEFHADEAAVGPPHEPDVWSRVRHVLLPKDYVRFRLSGEYAIDVADASGTLMLDVAQRRWSREMLDAAGIDARAAARGVRVAGRSARACRARPPRSPAFRRHADRRRRGRSGGRRGRHGHHAARRGQRDDRHVGRRLCRDRSSGHRSRRAGCTRSVMPIPGRWHVMGVTQAAGLSLRWFRDQIVGIGGAVVRRADRRSRARRRRAPTACSGRRT